MCKDSVRRQSQRNSELGLGTNLKMNDEVFAFRRKVIGVVYELKKLVPSLQRVEIRITDTPRCSKHSGLALTGGSIIWIPQNTLKMSDNAIYEVVAHEVVHALAGFGHDNKCPLMSPTHKVNNPLPKEVVNECFKKYFK